MDNKIYWSGYEWITQERWGQVHPDKSHWWYDPECVSICRGTNSLHLKARYNPKEFSGIGISDIGVGLVSCTEKFGFGIYSITAKLPRGENLWPAFWMWSWDSWPPEIDVFEGYTNKKKGYFNFNLKNLIGFWDVQTNVHYKDGESNKMSGGKTHFYGFKDPSKNFIKYTLIWERDHIKFFYDERLVRTIDDKKILDQFLNTKMNVIINNGITSDYEGTFNTPESDFIIKDFKFSPINYSK